MHLSMLLCEGLVSLALSKVVNAIEALVRLHLLTQVIAHCPLHIGPLFVSEGEFIVLTVSVDVFVLDDDILDATTGGEHGHLAEGFIDFGLGGFVFHFCVGDRKILCQIF